jgi:enoyl-[acyl-carrier protein] reductase II
MKLRTPLCDLMEIEFPVFLAGMGGVSYAEVCSAVSNAGGYGTLGMAASTPEEIRAQMREVRRLTDRPFGVDLLAALPELLEASVDVIVEEGASGFISGLGVPRTVIERFHEADVKVFSMCGRVEHAVAAADAGCDAVVAQGTEAGGHTGRVAGMALIPQIVDAVDIPVLAAGSIVDGRGLAAALAFGAQGVWMGTRFIASREGRAADAYKQAILDASPTDTTVTRCYSGKSMRVLRNAYVDEWASRPNEIQSFIEQSALSSREGLMNLSTDDYEDMDPDRSCMPVGQGCGQIDDLPSAGEIVRRVIDEACETMGRMQALVEESAPRNADAG